MTIETFPSTTLGAAAAAVGERLEPKRPFEVTTIADGEIINKPGIYAMSNGWYHDNCCAGPSISSGGLRKIDGLSPAHYWDTSPLNPEREPDEDEDASHFVLGRAVHMLLLGESGFREQFIIRPEKAPDGRAWNGNNLSCKQWLADAKAAGRSVITEDDLKMIRGMAKSLAADPLVASGLLNGEIERSIIWQDKETGVWVKSRPDALPVNADLVSDLKTIADASARSTRKAIESHGYFIQMALVGMGMKEVLGREISDEDYALVFVEKKRPYCVNVKPLDPADIYYGRCVIRRALRTFADCLAKNEWPGYADNGITGSISKFARERFENEIKNGLLPEVA